MKHSIRWTQPPEIRRESTEELSKQKITTTKKLLALAAIGILSTSVHAQDSESSPTKSSDTTKTTIWVHPGYTAIEDWVTTGKALRTRTLLNVDFSLHWAEVGYHGLSEFTKDLTWYFGRHVITAGIKDFELKLAGVVKTDAHGVLSEKYGLRYSITGKIGEKLGIYGYLDVVADETSWTATLFLGKSLGKRSSIELFESIDASGKDGVQPYTELQLNTQITKGLHIFVRGEMVGIGYKDAVYLLGISAPIK